MKLKLLRVCCKSFLVFLAIAGVAVAGFSVWIMNGPHSLNQFNDYFASSIVPEESSYSLSIGSSQIQWDGWSQPFSIHLKNAKLISEDQVVMLWPELRVSVDFWELLSGKVKSEEVTLVNPRLHIARRLDHRWVLLGEENSFVDLTELLGMGEAGKGKKMLPIQHIIVQNAEVRFEDQIYNIDIRSNQSNIEWHNGMPVQTLDALLTFDSDGQPVGLEIAAIRNVSEESLETKIGVDKFNPVSVCKLIRQCEGLPNIDVDLAGSFVISGDSDFVINDIAITLDGEDGTFEMQPNFPEVLPLETASISAQYLFADKTLNVEKVKVLSGGTEIEASAEFSKTEEGDYMSLSGKATNLPTNELYRFWPSHLAPESRKWVNESVRDGMATNAAVSFSLKPEDFEAEFFPDDFLHAKVEVEGASIHYLPDFPPAKNVQGVVNFTGTTITADTTSGELMESTVVPTAKFFFSDLNHPNVPLEINLNVDAAAKDVAELVKPPRFKPPKKSEIDLSKATGRLVGDISLAFNSFSNKTSNKVNWNKVKYNLKSELQNIDGLVLRKVLKLGQANGTMRMSNNATNVDLRAQLGRTPIRLSFNEDGKGSSSKLKGKLSTKQLEALGASIEKYVDGRVGVDATMLSKNGSSTIDAELNLKDAKIDIKDIGYSKPSGIEARLRLTPSKQGDEAQQSSSDIMYQSDVLNVSGKIRLEPETQKLFSADLKDVRYLGTNVSVKYREWADADEISISGKRLDISELMEDDPNDPFSLSDFPAMRLKLNVDEVKLGDNRFLNHVKGHINCTKARCSSADLGMGIADGGSMSVNIFREGNDRKFKLMSNDAGALFKVFDVTDRLRDGGISITGVYDDSRIGNPLNGRFILTDFKLYDAPILGKILNMSSLTGLFETLTSKGISFDKLATDFTFVKDVASFQNAKATGPSIGVLTEGDINLKGNMLNLKGNLAPAYTVNSVVGKIPIIGEMLAGGKDEGIFAFNFSVKGDMSDPNVSVNPLSVLTPGFTRKFFDIFDSPSKKEEPQPKKDVVKPSVNKPEVKQPKLEKPVTPEKPVTEVPEIKKPETPKTTAPKVTIPTTPAPKKELKIEKPALKIDKPALDPVKPPKPAAPSEGAAAPMQL